MKTKIFTLIATILFSQVAFGKITYQDRLALRELTREELSLLLKKTNKELEKQKTEIIPSEVQMIGILLEIYCKHPFVEADTGYKRKWFNKLYALIKQMSELKSKQKVAKKSRNKKLYLQYKLVYDKQLEAFAKLLKKPDKVGKKELSRLRKEARRKRREIEKKMDAEGIKVPKETGGTDEGDRRGRRQ